jgi:hypothetical protein
MAVLCSAVYFAGAATAQRVGAGTGGVVWALGMMGRWRLENDLGWWRSRIPGYTDPLMLFSPLSCLTVAFAAAALLLFLSMVERRFGWKAQAVAVVFLGLYQAARERVWFGEFIPALVFQPGAMPVLGRTGMLVAISFIALAVMRMIGGPNSKQRADVTRKRR